jgi:hypothetical protein
MEALTNQTKAQAAAACTILVSLFTLFFNLLRCRHEGSARANSRLCIYISSLVAFLLSIFYLYNSCLIVYLILTLCDAGSMEALTEQTEAHPATACTILVSLFTLFFNPVRCGSMEALTELTEAQAATACTILVSLFTLFFNPLQCRQH